MHKTGIVKKKNSKKITYQPMNGVRGSLNVQGDKIFWIRTTAKCHNVNINIL